MRVEIYTADWMDVKKGLRAAKTRAGCHQLWSHVEARIDGQADFDPERVGDFGTASVAHANPDEFIFKCFCNGSVSSRPAAKTTYLVFDLGEQLRSAFRAPPQYLGFPDSVFSAFWLAECPVRVSDRAGGSGVCISYEMEQMLAAPPLLGVFGLRRRAELAVGLVTAVDEAARFVSAMKRDLKNYCACDTLSLNIAGLLLPLWKRTKLGGLLDTLGMT